MNRRPVPVDGAVRAVVLAAAVWACGGCAPGSRRAAPAPPPPPAAGRVSVVNLQAMPTAVNWDDAPGSDGLRCRVYLFRKDDPLPAPAEGRLDFLVYDGVLTAAQVRSAQPVFIWSFAPADLPSRQVQSLVGRGYAFSLPWGARVPSAENITLACRYTAGGAEPVWSSPVPLPMKSVRSPS